MTPDNSNRWYVWDWWQIQYTGNPSGIRITPFGKLAEFPGTEWMPYLAMDMRNGV